MTTDPLDLTDGVPMTETDPHLWPRPTAASLLAGLHATTDADAAESLARGLGRSGSFVNHVHVALDGARMAQTMAQMRWAPEEVA
jgi:hypothetical protein